jgi:UDP-N-acetylmuramoylalanine--D-glutamate ligase
MADSLKQAIYICRDAAEKGDAVLLSPACASWGMYKNYEERGNEFKNVVNSLK